MDIKIILSFAVIVIIVIGILLLKSHFGKSPAEKTADVKAVANLEDEISESPHISKGIIADHSCIRLEQIPLKWIEKSKTDLHILFGHTSHGSQLTTGLAELAKFMGSPYIYDNKRPAGALDLRDNPFESTMDLGQPDNKAWAAETRRYLEKNEVINVVMWSWCGQLSRAGKRYVRTYLNTMQELEKEYPEVTFVYMTGHLDGTGDNGTLARNNKTIRDYCMSNNKVLYDFADIESYNPDGLYFGDKYANDACDYDSDGDKKTDRNWATEWQNTHTKGVDWYECSSAHSQPVNANMKAYAAWWLLARLAGWDGSTPYDHVTVETEIEEQIVETVYD